LAPTSSLGGDGGHSVPAGGGGGQGDADRSMHKRHSNGNIDGKDRASPPPLKQGPLLLMNDPEKPPPLSQTAAASCAVECLFSMVISLYQLMMEACDIAGEGSGAGKATMEEFASFEIRQPFTPEQESCRQMAIESWGQLLSSVSSVVKAVAEEKFLQQSLRALQTLLLCSGSWQIDDARDACCGTLVRHALPVSGGPELDGNGIGLNRFFTKKQILCMRALLTVCNYNGRILGVVGWGTVLRALETLGTYVSMQGAVADETGLETSYFAMWEATFTLPRDALSDLLTALAERARSIAHEEVPYDASLIVQPDTMIWPLARMAHICDLNAHRLEKVWDVLLLCTTDIVSSRRSDLRVMGTKNLVQLIKKALDEQAKINEEQSNAQEYEEEQEQDEEEQEEGAAEPNPNSNSNRRTSIGTDASPAGKTLVTPKQDSSWNHNVEEAQVRYLRSLDSLSDVADDVRKTVCEGLLDIVHQSATRLSPGAWGILTEIVARCVRVEVLQAGLDYVLKVDGGSSGSLASAASTPKREGEPSAMAKQGLEFITFFEILL